ncbi:MAG: hypothetical protein KC877_02940 [Candidatus Kaiserbacteria bacterium]|nr:hypothetical protein [Candidatus Kaiserbacteria bacterium]MCB9816882.1 hypothetical protein [Candidatus Nomurabacteria bacterium]
MDIPEALGVDVGGVIIDKVNDNTDTSFFSENFLNTSASPEVFRVLTRLVRERFGDRVFIVSKCGKRVEEKTLAWFAHHQFFELTGIKPEHVRFCRTRDGKAPICAELGITHFIDDRLEVLSYLTTVPHQFLFRGSVREIRGFEKHLAYTTQVSNWRQIETLLL